MKGMQDMTGMKSQSCKPSFQIEFFMLVMFFMTITSPWLLGTARADRAVAWMTSGEAALERDLNGYAARGLRVAAVSDGLPCTVTVAQTPEVPSPAASYRVVADRDLAANLPALTAQGFVPRFGHRRFGGRTHAIFERAGAAAPRADWRVVEFADLQGLPEALGSASAEGFQARVLLRYPFKSWPGLSERGLLLASRATGAKARESQVVIGQSRDIDKTIARDVAAAIDKGYSFDLLFTGSRDGSAAARRERVVVLLSRETGASTAGRALRIERTTAFGTFGSGVPLGAAPFWDDSYVYAFSPADRRTIWASPLRLSADEASLCAGLSFKLRFDAPQDLAWTIVGLAARKVSTGGYELVYVTDQRLPGS